MQITHSRAQCPVHVITPPNFCSPDIDTISVLACCIASFCMHVVMMQKVPHLLCLPALLPGRGPSMISSSCSAHIISDTKSEILVSHSEGAWWVVQKIWAKAPMTTGMPTDDIEAGLCLGCCCTQAVGLLPENFTGTMSTVARTSLADMATLCEPAPCDKCLALFRAPGSPAGPGAAAKPFVMRSCFLPWLSWRATAESGLPAICCRMPFDLPCARMHASNQQILERHSVSLPNFALQHA